MRTNSKWEVGGAGTYIQTIAPAGYDILINGSNKYLNFNSVSGSLGYGIRDNGGSIEVKNSGGAWAAIGTGAGTVTNVASADGSITVTNPTGAVDLAVVKAPKLTTARTIGGVSFDGTGNITVATATGGFTVSGGALALGANDLTMTGSLGATGARLTKVWAAAGEFTAAPTVGGAAVYYTGGTDVAVTDGGTGLSAIAALSILVANSSNTYVALTPGAGNSLRINAGGTAWEAYTPGAGGTGATTALDNLASVAINAALIPASAAGLDFGSTTKPWKDIWLAGSSGTPGTNQFKITGASTSGVRTITLPDASGTLVYGGGPLGTPSSGTGTNITGIPAANILAGSFGAGAYVISTSLQVATLELGAATDTTLTRVSAGLIAVEGVTLVDVSTGQTLTNKTLTTPVINGAITGTGQASAATASTIMMRDANINSAINNLVEGFTTTATAAGTTTLTITATYTQVWTGSSTQTVKLPTTSVLQGQQYFFVNLSSGAVTVQSSGANTIVIMAANTSCFFTAVVATPTTAANWSFAYAADIVTSGKSLSVSNTLTFTGTDASSVAFGTGGTVLYNGGALGTPSSGTGTNITGIPAANILAGSFGAGAYVISTSLQVATLELGAATDTTLSRVSAGVIAVEGTTVALVNVATLSSLVSVGTMTTGTLSTGFVIGGVTMTLGSDASGDMYYRNSSGVLTRIAAGAQGTYLSMGASNVPAWGSVSVSTFVVQDVPIINGTNVVDGTYWLCTDQASGSTMFIVYASSTTATILRLAKDTNTGNFYITHSTTLTVSSQGIAGVAVVGSSVYVNCTVAGTGSLRRYDKADLANVTTMTISGTNRFGNFIPMWSDNTNLYVNVSGGGTFDKYTISGTTVTNAANISYTGLVTPITVASDGTNMWVSSNNGSGSYAIKKFPIAGGSVTSTTTISLFANAYTSGVAGQGAELFMATTTQLGIGWFFNYVSDTAKTGIGAHLMAITAP